MCQWSQGLASFPAEDSIPAGDPMRMLACTAVSVPTPLLLLMPARHFCPSQQQHVEGIKQHAAHLDPSCARHEAGATGWAAACAGSCRRRVPVLQTSAAASGHAASCLALALVEGCRGTCTPSASQLHNGHAAAYIEPAGAEHPAGGGAANPAPHPHYRCPGPLRPAPGRCQCRQPWGLLERRGQPFVKGTRPVQAQQGGG